MVPVRTGLSPYLPGLCCLAALGNGNACHLCQHLSDLTRRISVWLSFQTGTSPRVWLTQESLCAESQDNLWSGKAPGRACRAEGSWVAGLHPVTGSLSQMHRSCPGPGSLQAEGRQGAQGKGVRAASYVGD